MGAYTVVFEGNRGATKGAITVKRPSEKYDDIESKNSLKLSPMQAEACMIDCPIQNGTVTVNVMAYGALNLSFCKLLEKEMQVVDGRLQLEDNMAFVAVVNRHGKGTKALHVVENFGIKKGALASTVSHDSHNLTIVYDTPENAAIAADELIAIGGGMTAVIDGKVAYTLPLPVGGLMSTLEAKELAEVASKMKEVEYDMGLTAMKNPLLRIVTLALPVIPEVKMTDNGLVDVVKKEFIPLFK